MLEAHSLGTPPAPEADTPAPAGGAPDQPGQSFGAVLDAVKGLGRLELIAVLRADQLRRWRRGERRPAEDYVREVPALRDDPELALDLVFSEFVLRRDVLAEAPALDEYLGRFPRQATALRHQVLVEALWQGAVRTRARGGPSPATAAAPSAAGDWTEPQADGGAGPAAPPAPPGYELRGELGRGGMGLVLRGHDLHLGRDLAVKLLREEFRGQPHLVRRFLNEARICGRLQHPGVVPVHALGALPDGRPYFTMKLVEGRTLADLLDERAGPGQDRPRLLGIFEQVCQAMAYAHSQGVIHRDLKPGNVMVGAFGEVQVMDWGLAKVLERGEAFPAPAPPAPEGGPGAECDSDGDAWFRTQSGGAVGTLPYVPPEQARGEVERMDERSDVFGLGAILCHVLTGRPPFLGRDGTELLARARACDHAEALAALDGCGAGAELVRLAKSCLAAEPSARPGDAGVVARAVTAHLAGVQERLRAAEVERAAAQARAAAERRARRRTAWLAAAVLLLALLAGGAGLWWAGERAAQERRVGEAAVAQERRVDEAANDCAASLRAWNLPGAKAAVLRAELGVGDDGPAGLRDRVREMRDHLTLVADLDRIRLNAAALVDGQLDFASADRDYAAAFRKHGLAAEGEDVGVVAKRIQDSPLREQLVAALDDWAAATKNDERRAWLLAAAREAQPGEWSDRFRDANVWRDRGALAGLAREADVTTLSPQLLTALGVVLLRTRVDAVPLLRRAQARHPADFWLNFLLGNGLYPLLPEEAIGFYRAAIAARPETSAVYVNLGALMREKRRTAQAIEAWRTAVALDPGNVTARLNLAAVLMDEGRDDEGVEECRQAVFHLPDSARAHYGLGAALYRKSRLDDATEEYRQAIARDADYGMAHFGLGNVLYRRGQLDEAIEEYGRAIRADPDYAPAHANLAIVLAQKDRLDDAVKEHRRAIELAPGNGGEHFHLGLTLKRMGRLDEAIDEYRLAVDKDPGHETAPGALAEALMMRGRFADAAEVLRRWRDKLPGGHPRRADSALMLAQSEQCRARYATSAYFYAEAFAERPELADKLSAACRHDAARVAALAGCGQGEDAALLPDKVVQARRRQALVWMRADLTAWTRQLDGGQPAARAAVAKAMQQWQKDGALAGVRDPEGLARLPEVERQQWRELWGDVAALLDRAGAPVRGREGLPSD